MSDGRDAAAAVARADVVIPVYGNALAVERCLTSLVTCADPAIGRIIVIDDASPDAETRRLLDAWAAKGAIELHRLAHNGGYVKAVNLGMAATVGDVVLLNSDTEVHGDWLSRMLACLHADPQCATVTPLSNNATICSYPWMGAGSMLPEGCSLALLDTLCAQCAAQTGDDGVERTPGAVIPTGIGFCLLIRRAALEQLGLFDAETFGLGYGEENDFCQRARAHGWHHRACTATYVFHAGGGSFAERKDALAAAAEAILAERYPDYSRRVRDFVLYDGLRAVRDALDLARATMGPAHAQVVMRERAAERDWFMGWLAHLVRGEDAREAAALAPQHQADMPSAVSVRGWRQWWAGLRTRLRRDWSRR